VSRRDEVTDDGSIVRYTFLERVLHWWTALTFVYLLLSGLALAYPRMTWLYDVLGGGQTVRFLHPWAGVGFVLGLLSLLVAWWRDMRFEPQDRAWVRQLGRYAREGHARVDTGRWNAGQKGYFWLSILSGAGLLATGIALWVPGLLSSGWILVARLLHHLLYLLALAGFIIHVYTSTVMFPGSFGSMTSGLVERRWAAYHHPRWFRAIDARNHRDRDEGPAEEPVRPGERR
jgi:formate dehydrogenase subunit gamma